MKISSLKTTALLLAALGSCLTPLSAQDATKALGENIPKPDGKPADISKPVKVFILLGQSNMVGLGTVFGDKGESLEKAVKQEKLYPFLTDTSGAWAERQDVRFTQVMVGRGGPFNVHNNTWLKVGGANGKYGTFGPEFGLGHQLGNAINEPVLILKSCIGNRSLSWDLLPPGSKRSLVDMKQRDGSVKKMVVAGYKDAPDFWEADPAKGVDTPPPPFVDKKSGKPIEWYAGKQWDDDLANAKKVLSELETYYPGAKGYEVAGFFWWQGEKDAGNEAHASKYEENLVALIKALRAEFKAPAAKFVIGTMGEAKKGMTDNTGKVLAAHLAVDGTSGKYPEFKGNVATVYTHPMARGGSGNGHYGKNAKVYMDVGISMGDAMVGLLKSK